MEKSDGYGNCFRLQSRLGELTIFNIKGNAYRLITEINYKTGKIFIRHVLTHAAYRKGGWKQWAR